MCIRDSINGVMGDLAHDMQTALPTDFDVTGSIRTAVDGVVGKAASAFTIALNITNFNNYSSEDIRQLTNEVMETANQFAQRKGVVFAGAILLTTAAVPLISVCILRRRTCSPHRSTMRSSSPFPVVAAISSTLTAALPISRLSLIHI